MIKLLNEHQEQALFVEYIRWAYPNVLIHSIPNGARLAGDEEERWAQMAKLKAEGLRPGCPDLFAACPRGQWHGAYIEMKTLSGKLSDVQKEFIAQAEAAGYYTIVGHGFEQARELFDDYISW